MNNGKQETVALAAEDISLASVVIQIRSDKDLALPRTTGQDVYAAFLKLVAQRDPRIASSLHSSDEDLKPFTLSWLNGRFGLDGNVRLLKSNQPYWFRVTGFSGDVIRCLLSWITRPPEAVRLYGENLPIIRIAAQDHPAASLGSLRSLYYDYKTEAQPLPRDFTIRFLTPTTFRTGDHNTVFPLPRLVFCSLAQKWNQYAPESVGATIHEMIHETVIVSRYRLRTQMVEYDGYRQIGFVGEASFHVIDQAPESLLRIIHLLADFAFYAGVGYKTTMGMGQVRRIAI